MFAALKSPSRWLAMRRARNLAKANGEIDLDLLDHWQVKELLSAAGMKAIATSKYGLEFPVANLGNYESYLKVATGKVWASWKACDLTAQVASNVPFKVLRGSGSEGVEVAGLAQLLQYPNDTMTFGELVYLTVMHVKITGNAYWLKVEPNLKGDRPVALIPLNPRRVQVVVSRETGELQGYRVSGGTVTATIPPEEVIHFKRPHPNNDWYGIGDIEAGSTMMGDTVSRSNWKEAFWKNGATPSGILVKEDNTHTQEQWEKLKAEFSKQYSGTKNAGKMAWLSGKWATLRVGLTLAEMADIENRKLSIEEVSLLHGVPLSVLGVREAANYATAEIDDTRFRSYGVLPMVRLVQDTMNTDLVAGFGPQFRIKFAMTGLVNVGQVVQNLTPAFDRGWLSINEAREALGLPTDEENPLWTGHFINAGLVPLELAGIANQQATEDAAKGIVARFIAETTAPRREDHSRNGNGQPHRATS